MSDLDEAGIHIENRYFPWLPMAERIKSNAAKTKQGERTSCFTQATR